VLVYIYVANAGIFYFIIREIGKAVSLCMVFTGHEYISGALECHRFAGHDLPLVSSYYVMMFISEETNVDYSDALQFFSLLQLDSLWFASFELSQRHQQTVGTLRVSPYQRNSVAMSAGSSSINF
jgi:hypothetical protein